MWYLIQTLIFLLITISVFTYLPSFSDATSSDDVETIDTTSGLRNPTNYGDSANGDGVLRINIVHSPDFGASLGDRLSGRNILFTINAMYDLLQPNIFQTLFVVCMPAQSQWVQSIRMRSWINRPRTRTKTPSSRRKAMKVSMSMQFIHQTLVQLMHRRTIHSTASTLVLPIGCQVSCQTTHTHTHIYTRDGPHLFVLCWTIKSH